ncbi:hypothetical protein GGR32_000385 [Mesonia hippocampi]|uniref:Uncharacterized protein n=1 Tax=Mesonia hippocampi TaxID=1628250 RepID=A0A840ENB2_9FLAO|nr:hypothetical protein [Mesonia hippocampi]MBB4118113.1 hypothetical protein [Mesonia hippocampi]
MKLPGMNIAQNWEENLTWEGILDLESKGVDVTEIKERFLIRQKKQEEIDKYSNILRFTLEKVDAQFITNKTNIDKLENLDTAINNPTHQMAKDTIKPPLLFGKSKWRNDVTNAKIIYSSVIQSDKRLWEKVTSDITPAAVLLVYSINPKYAKNIAVLKKTSKYLNDFRDLDAIDKSKFSKNMVKLYNKLNDAQSSVHITLDETILDDLNIEANADIRVVSFYVYDDTPLPNKKLPSDGIIPFAWYRALETSNDNFGYGTKIIPAKYYL